MRSSETYVGSDVSGGTFCFHVQGEGLRLTLSFSHSENGSSKVFGNVELTFRRLMSTIVDVPHR